MLAIWLRYNGADTSLSFEIMVDILLIVLSVYSFPSDIVGRLRARAARPQAQ